ncbi:MAG: N(4)-(beta-N-acetylglucosaminyl)-L-asparaginase [Ignavibacteria bacterium]|nr:N(4)-(beta-N-acetylglucosaminyl)-L-asparaginase [Ignavibacteria bacterium]
MRFSRRKFIKSSSIIGSSLLFSRSISSDLFASTSENKPIVVSTWKPNLKSNARAMEVLLEGNSSLDAIEEGIKVTESDPNDNSVGLGGIPDELGIVTLDASIMDWNGNAGSVAFLQNILHPISVARLVMEKTNHVMLVGEGAKKFAIENGFKEENLLTEKSNEAWLKWKSKKQKTENHDTIGMLAIDKMNNMSGGVSTSGMSFKLHGRVGDSPIIGAAMFVDNKIGGAVSTGNGEYVMRTLGSFLIVEKMREGFSPQNACEYAIERLFKSRNDFDGVNVSYLALNKSGEVGAYSLKKGFTYCVTTTEENKSYESDCLMK